MLKQSVTVVIDADDDPQSYAGELVIGDALTETRECTACGAENLNSWLDLANADEESTLCLGCVQMAVRDETMAVTAR